VALIGAGGLEGASGMAEAVTLRQATVGGRNGEDLLAAEAMETVLRALPNKAVELGYLLALGASNYGQRHLTLVMPHMAALLKSVNKMKDLLPAGASPARLVATLEELRLHIAESVLPVDIRAWVEHRLAELYTGHQTADKAEEPKVRDVREAQIVAQPRTHTNSFAAGSLLFQQGDVGDEAYLVLSGRVEIFLSKDGKEVRLGFVDHGSILGEMSLVDDSVRMASARAVVKTDVRIIPRDMFRSKLDRLQEADPIMRKLIGVFVQRLRSQADLAWDE